MTAVAHLDDLAAAIASSSPKVKAYAKAQAAATQSQELDIQSALIPAPHLYIDARTYGAKFDGVTDDTAAIQAALDAAPLTGYLGSSNANDWPAYSVVFPPGRARITAPLKVHANTVVSGAGEASTYIHNLGIGRTFELATGGEVQVTLRDFGIIINSRQGLGIDFVQAGAPSILGDACHRFENMQVVGGQRALFFTGSTENRVVNFKAYRQTPVSGEAAVYLGGTDHFLERVTVAQPQYVGSSLGGSGLRLNTSNSRIVNCKVFGGNANGTTETHNPAFRIIGQRNTITALEVQDFPGWAVQDDQGLNTWVNIVADSCLGGFRFNCDYGPVIATGLHAVNRGGVYLMSTALSVPNGKNAQVDCLVTGVANIFGAGDGTGNKITVNGSLRP